MTLAQTAENFRRAACKSKGTTPQSTCCECGGVLGPVAYSEGHDRIECDQCGASARDRRTKYGRPMPRQPGWYVDTGTRPGSGGMGLIGPFRDEQEASMESMRAESYHRQYGIADEPHERFCVGA